MATYSSNLIPKRILPQFAAKTAKSEFETQAIGALHLTCHPPFPFRMPLMAT